MLDAERMMTVEGRSLPAVVRAIQERHGCTQRQAYRYTRAVRAIYAAHDGLDAPTLDEHLRLVLERSAEARAAQDFNASVKALEVYARLRGWLDRKSSIHITGQIDHTHVAALEVEADDLSDDERAALLAFRQARERKLAARAEGVVGSLGELTPAQAPAGVK